MSKKLFVGNLPFTTTQDDLSQMFAQWGPVQSAAIITDRYTGQSRGFGFVELLDEQAPAAIAQMNGNPISGRPLIVNEARPREAGAPGRSEGRPGGGFRGGEGRFEGGYRERPAGDPGTHSYGAPPSDNRESGGVIDSGGRSRDRGRDSGRDSDRYGRDGGRGRESGGRGRDRDRRSRDWE